MVREVVEVTDREYTPARASPSRGRARRRVGLLRMRGRMEMRMCIRMGWSKREGWIEAETKP
jgi:hypothetical protein